MCVDNIPRDSTYIDVDSTIGFPKSGTLEIQLENGLIYKIGYTDKTINQFLNCTSINFTIPEKTEIKLDIN